MNTKWNSGRPTATNREVVSVSELTRDARRMLEQQFAMVFVEGEISNLARPGSGHWYFTLKDDKAQIRCAMFRNRNSLVRFDPRDGQQIIVRGRISLYEARGDFQLIAEFLEDSGDGALRRAFEKLRADLQAEGLFDESRKKPIPETPAHIAIITSPHGAAIRDVISVMKRRFPAVHISILPVQVQGEDSVPQIVQALDFANRYTEDPFDLVLLTRGGGSLEDLWSFNTEPVARAIAGSNLPVVCAVGHESDVSIADFVADLRAPTPSAAAELITPDSSVWQDNLAYLNRRLLQNIAFRLEDEQREVRHLTARLRHPSQTITDLAQRLDDLERRSQLAVRNALSATRSRLEKQRLVSPVTTLAAMRARLENQARNLVSAEMASRRAREAALHATVGRLETLSPLKTLQRGYAIVSTEPDGHVVTDASEVSEGDRIRARLQQGSLIAEVTDIVAAEEDENEAAS